MSARGVEMHGFKLLGNLTRRKRAWADGTKGEGGALTAHGDGSFHLFKHEVVARLKALESARLNIGDEGATFGNDDGAASAAGLREVERAGDVGKGRGLQTGAVGKHRFTRALDSTLAGKFKELCELAIGHRNASRRNALSIRSCRGAHGRLKAAEELARINGHRNGSADRSAKLRVSWAESLAESLEE